MEFGKVPSREQRAAVCNRDGAQLLADREVAHYNVNYSLVVPKLKGDFNIGNLKPHSKQAVRSTVDVCYNSHQNHGCFAERNIKGSTTFDRMATGHNFSKDVLTQPQTDVDGAPPLWNLKKMENSIYYRYNRARPGDTAKHASIISKHITRTQRAKGGYLSTGNAMSSRTMPGLRVKYNVVEIPLGKAVSFGAGYDVTGSGSGAKKKKGEDECAATGTAKKMLGADDELECTTGKFLSSGVQTAAGSGAARARSARPQSAAGRGGNQVRNPVAPSRPQSAAGPRRPGTADSRVSSSNSQQQQKGTTSKVTSWDYADPVSAFNATKRSLGKTVSWGKPKPKPPSNYY